MSEPYAVVVCPVKCWDCMTGQCPGGEHRWANDEDIDHAVSIGKPESALGRCGCWCWGTVVESDVPEPDVELQPLVGGTCATCGETGACAWDVNGDPLIHTAWRDEADT